MHELIYLYACVDWSAEVGERARADSATAEPLAEAIAGSGAGLLLLPLEGPHGGAQDEVIISESTVGMLYMYDTCI